MKTGRVILLGLTLMMGMPALAVVAYNPNSTTTTTGTIVQPLPQVTVINGFTGLNQGITSLSNTLRNPQPGLPFAPAVPPPPPINSINPAANTGQASQNNGSGANNMMGAALIAAGVPLLANPNTVPIGTALIAMGMMALAQGASDSNAAGQSGQTGASSIAAPTGTPSTTTTAAVPPTLDNGLNAAFKTPAGAQGIAAIQAAGGTVTADGITMPDGTTKPFSAFASTSSMSANGMDGAGIAKMAAQIEKKALAGLAGASGVALSEGTSPAGSSIGSGGFGGLTLHHLKNPFDMSAAEKAKLAAGKTLNTAGGDPIGVKMDDLFAMIHRAYDRKRGTSGFIDNPAGRVPDDESELTLATAPGSPSAKPAQKLITRTPASVDMGGP